MKSRRALSFAVFTVGLLLVYWNETRAAAADGAAAQAKPAEAPHTLSEADVARIAKGDFGPPPKNAAQRAIAWLAEDYPKEAEAKFKIYGSLAKAWMKDPKQNGKIRMGWVQAIDVGYLDGSRPMGPFMNEVFFENDEVVCLITGDMLIAGTADILE